MNVITTGAGRRLAHRLAIACTLALPAGGCLVIPMNEPTPGSRQNISEEAVQKFEKGVTTREDVLLAFGEPDWVSGDDLRYGYIWSRIRWFWILAASSGYSGGIAAGDVSKEEKLQITFDAQGRLLDSRLTKSWSGDSSVGPGTDGMDRNSERRAYSIQLQPRPHPPVAPAEVPTQVTVEVSEVRDLRNKPDRLGVFTSLGVKVGDIQDSRSVPDFLRRELILEAEAAGNRVVAAGADVSIEPRLTKFWIWTESTLFHFDVFAEVECDLTRTSASEPDLVETRHYSGRAVKRTYLIPGAEFFAGVAGESVDELLAKIRSDGIWKPFPAATEDAG